MDKKSLIGLGLIAAILGIWLYVSGPSKEQTARNKQTRDSIELTKRITEAKELEKIAAIQKTQDTAFKANKAGNEPSDSAKASALNDNYKDFSVSLTGKKQIFIIENELIKATISNKGGQIEKVELKKYHRPAQTTPLILFNSDSTNFALKLNTYDRSRVFSTDSFYFKSVNQTANSITLKFRNCQAGKLY